MSVSMARVMGAAGIVLVTTLDDAVWLVPFVANETHRPTAVLHAFLFVATLECMALSVSILTLVSEKSVLGGFSETGFTALGAVLCWLLAGFLLYRSIRKRRRRRQLTQRQQQEEEEEEDQRQAAAERDLVADTEQGRVKREDDPLVDNREENNVPDDNHSPKPWMVISLTFLGSLDEISYFPSLLLGGIFNAIELCMGTLIAALVMLLVVLVFLRPCKPLMDCFDSIPLYGVVGIFAVLFTAELIWDIASDE